MYDVAIIGGGPTGLAAAIKAASEGLSVVVLEKSDKFGGRPHMSPCIENVPGWPEGITGPTLSGVLERQAQKFGALLEPRQPVIGLRHWKDHIEVFTANALNIKTHSVIIAVGETTPKIDKLAPYEGRGVEYACDATTLHLHAEQHVLIVGGGNASAQLALALAASGARRVTILTRSDLTQTTSLYLRQRLAEHWGRDKTPWISIVRGEILRAHGHERLTRVTIEYGIRNINLRPDHTYVFISGVPPTGWFGGGAKTAEGYILTGHDVPVEDWPLERAPYPQESSVPGVFVAGDVRAGATGGITAAFGEGVQACQRIKREYLPGLAPAREKVKT